MYGQRSDLSGWFCDFGNFLPGPLGMIINILFWVGVILIIVKVVQLLFFPPNKSGSSGALKILKNRYASGEITKGEYEQIKRDLA